MTETGETQRTWKTITSEKLLLVALVALAATALAVVIGGMFLANSDKVVPPELIAIGSSSAGAIGGMLVGATLGGANRDELLELMKKLFEDRKN